MPFAPRILWVCLLASLGGLLSASNVVAQAPAPSCATDAATNATLVLPSTLKAQLDDTPISVPVRLVVVGRDGSCAGSVVWNRNDTAVTVWGQAAAPVLPDTATAPLSPGDSLWIRAYAPESGQLLGTARPSGLRFRRPASYAVTTPHYQPDGIYVVDQIHFRSVSPTIGKQ